MIIKTDANSLNRQICEKYGLDVTIDDRVMFVNVESVEIAEALLKELSEAEKLDVCNE